MVNLLEVNFRDDGVLDVQFNEELLELFGSEEEFIGLVDNESMNEALMPIANEILKRAKGYKGDK